jgi:hypothetical protein
MSTKLTCVHQLFLSFWDWSSLITMSGKNLLMFAYFMYLNKRLMSSSLAQVALMIGETELLWVTLTTAEIEWSLHEWQWGCGTPRKKNYNVSSYLYRLYNMFLCSCSESHKSFPWTWKHTLAMTASNLSSPESFPQPVPYSKIHMFNSQIQYLNF